MILMIVGMPADRSIPLRKMKVETDYKALKRLKFFIMITPAVAAPSTKF
jgi:hypothetical protein